MIRLSATFAAALFFALNCAYAQAAGEGNEKASLQLQEKMATGAAQDLIVVYDDNDIQRNMQALQSELSLPSHHNLMIEHRAARYAEKKQGVLSAFGSHEAIVLKQYSHLPLNFVRVHSKEVLDRLLAHPDITGIYEDTVERLTLAESLPLIGQPQVSAQGNMGVGTAVAVLDTGVDYTRSTFGSCISPGVPANCKVVNAQDFAPSDGQLDNNGHGTNVAGIVLGVAPGTKIVALDVFRVSHTNGEPTAVGSDILNAINWVIANKAAYNIVAINLSLGSGKATSPVTSGLYNSAVNQAQAAGILTVAAAGNDGFTNALSQLAATAGVVSVGAVYDSTMPATNWGDPLRCSDATPAADEVTCFSNSASFLTLFAPGSQILASGITQGGTSQAAPHVAGAVAVLRASFPNETLDQTVARLTNGAMVTDSRNDITKPRLNLQIALGQTASCIYSISEMSKSFGPSSSSGNIVVSTGAGCTWIAASSTSSASWITVTSGSSGSGNGTANYSVSANSNATSRTGTITVAGQIYTITQSGSVGAEANILLNPGFEDGQSPWIDSAANGFPVITTYLKPTATNSSFAWLCGYDNCVDKLYQDITIPANAQSAYVQFDYWITTDETSSAAAYDSMTIRIYSPPDASKYTYWILSNLDSTTAWHKSPKYDVSAFKGQTIRLQFFATTDSIFPTNFIVDDVTLMVSGAAPDTQPPTVPAGLIATAISTSAINLAWAASTDNIGVTAHRIYRDSKLLATLGNVRNYGDNGLATGSSHSYTVSACDAAGNCSAQSAATIGATAFSDMQPPTVPAGLIATATGTSTINLAWTASTDNVGVTTYKIYRSGTLLATLGNVRSYVDNGLTASTAYSYTVSACDTAGNCSAQSTVVFATTTSPYYQATPIVFDGASTFQVSGNSVNITISKIRNNSSTLTSGSLRIELWALNAPYSYSGNAAGYKTASIRTSLISGLSDQIPKNTVWSEITLNLPFIAPPTTGYTNYALFLRQYDPTNCPTADHFCTIDYLNYHEVQPPTVPTSLTATAVSNSQINLAWLASTDNMGVATYKVYRGGSLVAILGNVRSYSDIGLSASTTYSYKVSACDAAGNCSSQSSVASAITPAPPDTQAPTKPAGLTATVASSSQINLAWTASTDNVGVAAYKIYSSGHLVTTLGNVTSSSRTTTPSTSYSYTVSACDVAGNCSAQSTPASAMTPAPSDTQPPTVPTGLTATAVKEKFGIDLEFEVKIIGEI